MTAARLGMSMTLAGLEPASFASEGDASLITPWGLVKPKPLKTRVEHMRTPVVEPGPQAWEACMMPLHYVRQCQCSSTQLCIYIYIYIYTYIHICMYIHICVYQASHSIVGGLDTRIGLVRGLGSQGQGWRQPEQATVLIMIYGLSVWFLYPLWL